MKDGMKSVAGSAEGVTLIELLVVLAIVGILVGVGVNMMGGTLTKHRLGSASEELSTRLRAAPMIAVARNQPVTVVFSNTPGSAAGQEDFYVACLDTDDDSDCSDEGADGYLNLDSGRLGALETAKKQLHRLLEIYEVQFSAATPLAVTFEPPSGLVKRITDSGGALVNGVVCLRAEIGDEGDDWDDRFDYRRVTVDPVVGRTNSWRNVAGITENPGCRDNPKWQEVD
jgi:prepilin-type N-terminal cleavage/methylation domain-containing protein